MKISVLQKGGSCVEQHWTVKDLPELLASPDSVVWADIEGWSDEVESVFRDIFRFHPLSIEHAVETRNHPMVEVYPDYLFFTVHGVKTETNSRNFVTRELDCFLGSNFVVTYRTEDFRSLAHIDKQIASSSYIFSKGADYLLYEILDRLVDQYVPVVDDFDDVITAVEERILGSNGDHKAILGEIMELKRNVGRLIRISSKQSAALYRLAHGEFRQIPPATLPFYRDVYDHLMRVSGLAESYRDLINSLLDIHLSVLANKTNEVMKLLAIFSAIMLPLSLIAGIYGMNLKLPDAEDPRAFLHVVLAMMAISAILLAYFWRRGWLRFERSEAFTEDRRKRLKALKTNWLQKKGGREEKKDSGVDSGE